MSWPARTRPKRRSRGSLPQVTSETRSFVRRSRPPGWGAYAPHPGGRDRLTKDLVSDVTCGKDPRDLRFGRVRAGQDITLGVEGELPGHELGYRGVPNRDENTITGLFGDSAGPDVAQADPTHD